MLLVAVVALLSLRDGHGRPLPGSCGLSVSETPRRAVIGHGIAALALAAPGKPLWAATDARGPAYEAFPFDPNLSGAEGLMALCEPAAAALESSEPATTTVSTVTASRPGDQGSPFDWTAIWKDSSAEPDGEEKRTGLPITEVAAILQRDLSERKYILTGQMTSAIFADDARFVDPNNAVTGLQRYRRALSFLFDPSRSSLEDVRVSIPDSSGRPTTLTADYVAQGELKLPWHPRISPWKGHITYTLNAEGLIVSQVDEWSISRVTALRQTFGIGAR